MSMIIANNMDATRSLNMVDTNSDSLSKSLQKIASGMKIRGASDGASEYSISEQMRNQIRSLDQANSNAQNSNAMMQTLEGALQNTLDILKTLKERALEAANDSDRSIYDRETTQKDINSFIDQIDANAGVTYNGKVMVDGSLKFKGVATASGYMNMNLSSDTLTTDALSDLKDRAGDSLGIESTDRITLSVVNYDGTMIYKKDSNGNDYTGDTTLADLAQGRGFDWDDSNTIGFDYIGEKIYSPNGTNVISAHASNVGVRDQIAGIAILVTDNEGHVRRDVTEILNDFVEVTRAEDESDEHSLNFHLGPGANHNIKVGLSDMRAAALGLRGEGGQPIDIFTQEKSEAAVATLDNAIATVMRQKGFVGAIQSRIDYSYANNSVARENTAASESVIRDADMASEMTNYSKLNVLTQSSQMMLAQSNRNSSTVIDLLM